MQFPGKGTPPDPHNANFDELMKLLGPQGAAQPPVTAAAATSAAARPRAQLSNAAQVQLQHQRQRITQQQLPQSQPQQAQPPRQPSIADELQAMLGVPNAAAQGAQSQRPASAPARQIYAPNDARANPRTSATPSAPTAAAATAAPPGGPPPGRVQPGVPQTTATRANVTQEQVIVGHFCRHALATLTRLTADRPNSLEMQQHLKMNIKRLWAQWVAARITKSTLLETVARIVRASCPAAANVNVISEFRTWYHQQLNAQREQNRVRRTNAARTVAAPAVPTAVANTQPAPAGFVYPGAPRTTAVPSVRAPVHGMAAPGMPGAPVHAGARHRQPSKPHAAKTIPQKTVPANTVPRAPVKVQPSIAGAPSIAVRKPVPPKPRAPAAPRPKPAPKPVKGEVLSMAPVVTMVKPEPVDISNSVGSTIAAAKKQKPPVKKPSPKGKKPAPSFVVAGAVTPNQKPRPPQQRPAPQPKSFPVAGAAPSLRPGAAVPGAPSATGDVTKKKKGADMLDVCGNIVDIDNEQSRLVGETPELSVPGGTDLEGFTDMLLDGPMLRLKMESVMRKFGLGASASKDTMELMALAVRERLSYVLERCADVAMQRVDAERALWESRSVGLNVYDQLEKMREDEERSLAAQADLRTVKWRQQQEEVSAREAAEKRSDDPNSKQAAQQAELKKKAKAALEKKRAADSSQRSALSGAISGIGKKRRKTPSTLKPLSIRALSNSLKSDASKGVPSAGSTGASGATANVATSTPHAGAQGTTNPEPQHLAVRPPITLKDVLHFMSSEANMRQSTLVYKWYARLGAPRRE